MTRIVRNNSIGNNIGITKDTFVDLLPKSIQYNDRLEMAKGVILVCTKPNNEGLYILNDDGTTKCVGQTSNVEIPSNIIDAINSAIQGINIGEIIDGRIEEYDAVVSDSANTLNERINDTGNAVISANTRIDELVSVISQLNDRIDNLKITDHVLIKENAYYMLIEAYKAGKSIRITKDGSLIEESDYDSYAPDEYDEITYNEDIYYCIPEDNNIPIQPEKPWIDFDNITEDGNVTIDGETEIEDNYIVIGENGVIDSEGYIVIDESNNENEDENEINFENIDENGFLNIDSNVGDDGYLEMNFSEDFFDK